MNGHEFGIQRRPLIPDRLPVVLLHFLKGTTRKLLDQNFAFQEFEGSGGQPLVIIDIDEESGRAVLRDIGYAPGFGGYDW